MVPQAQANSQRSMALFTEDDAAAPESLALRLAVSDRETIDELVSFPDGSQREQFALSALRIGVLALRQARGRVDADLIQRETQRMLSGMQTQLSAHTKELHDRLAGSLKEYFDPASGRFHERVQQLVRPDGELEQVLRRQVGSEDSELCKTLVGYLGQQSPLMKLLNPAESQGLLAALAQTLETQLTAQRAQVLREFSLDNKDGALARMIAELTANHGQLSEALQKKINSVAEEFSLDKDDSALSRLVRNVERAQTTITREFSLDNETSALSRLAAMLDSTRGAIDENLTLDGDSSALSRLRRELVGLLDKHTETNAAFQEEVKVALSQMLARRQEAQRSTQHGLVFEEAVCQYLEHYAAAQGDLAIRTGNQTGLIKSCKKGDCVLELGPESAAPGARLVVEAKESADYTLAKARAEMQTARENRGAQIGLFIFSKRTAPAGLDEVHRLGHDIYLVWDPEDVQTNLHFKISLTLARALCVRTYQQTESQAADFQAIGEAILEIERQSQFLGDVTKHGETIRNGAEKVLERVRITRASLERQVETLQARIDDLKQVIAAGDGTLETS